MLLSNKHQYIHHQLQDPFKFIFKGFVLSIFYPNAYETHLSFSLPDGDDRLRQPKRSATAPH